MNDRKLHVGDLVEVRSREEILATLDKDGRLAGLPFMPQMFEYCGQQFTVEASAHKTCDVVAGDSRRFPGGVHLDLRCDGRAYGGCQASCLLFWNDAWLKSVPPADDSAAAQGVTDPNGATRSAAPGPECTEEDVLRATHSKDESGETVYFCQATRVPYFTEPLAWWDVRQYIEDYTSGNISLRRLLIGTLYQLYNHATQASRPKIGRPGRWLYDRFQRIVGGQAFPHMGGRLPQGERTPTTDLQLQPGELVRVKSHDQILETVTPGLMNRGLLFDKEMVPFCGSVFRVKTRVTTFVDERTGKLATLKTPAVILEGVWCQSRFSNKKMFCRRALHSWWREVWLERVSDDVAPGRLSDSHCMRVDGRYVTDNLPSR